MRVILSPRASAGLGEAGLAVARRLAGPEGRAVSLLTAGVRTLGRALSAAEVSAIRQALSDDEVRQEEGPVVGYVCRGVRLDAGGVTGGSPGESPAVDGGAGGGGGARGGTGAGAEAHPGGSGVIQAVAVADHVNLTWRSPLTGPNDDRLGPRFPSMTGIYAPEAVIGRAGAAGGIIVEVGVVAGVDDEDRLRPFETGVAHDSGCVAASRELVPVVILAAHLGLRVAALVVTAGCEQEETHSGRS